MRLEPTPTLLFLLPDLGGGGAQRVMLTLANGIDRARFGPRVLVLGKVGAASSAMPNGLTVETLGASRLRESLPRLVRRVREIRPHAIVSTLAYTNLALLALKPLMPRETRLVVREANVPSASLAALPRLVPGRLAYRALYPRADRVLAQTQAIAEMLTNIAPGVRGKLRLLRNPVDVAQIRAGATAVRRAPGPGLRLVAVGRLTRQKGFDRLIEIVSKVRPTTHVTICGEGPDRSALQAQIVGLGLEKRITLTGFLNDLPNQVAGADAMVVPSRWEGLPNAALEGLALGVPVVASPEAALGEVQRLAPAAVTIAHDDADFIAAISQLPVRDNASTELRDTLLPSAFEVRSVLAGFEAIMTEVFAEPGA